MACGAGIYVVNTSQATIAANNIIPLPTIVRRYGSGVNLFGTSVGIFNPGYYKVSAHVSYTPTAAGDVTISLQQNGVDIPGATATFTGVLGVTEQVSFDVLVRKTCCVEPLNLNLVSSAEVTLVNAGMVVTKQ